MELRPPAAPVIDLKGTPLPMATKQNIVESFPALKKLGFNVIARANEIITFPETGLVAGVKKIQEKRDEIKRVIRAGIKDQPLYSRQS